MVWAQPQIADTTHADSCKSEVVPQVKIRVDVDDEVLPVSRVGGHADDRASARLTRTSAGNRKGYRGVDPYKDLGGEATERIVSFLPSERQGASEKSEMSEIDGMQGALDSALTL